jgi:fructose-1,6-bisphosphatase/inositol monophosphatase family enzyme
MQPDGDRLWTAIRAARVAGEEPTRRFRATDRTHCDADLAVPQADAAVEEHIVRIISEAFPGDNIISEETSPEFLTRDRWVVDPLDGTMNFHNGVPHFAVSIAFERKMSPDIGVVYYLPAGRLFVGVEDGGAYLNGREIRPSGTTSTRWSGRCRGYGGWGRRRPNWPVLPPAVSTCTSSRNWTCGTRERERFSSKRPAER